MVLFYFVLVVINLACALLTWPSACAAFCLVTAGWCLSCLADLVWLALASAGTAHTDLQRSWGEEHEDGGEVR